MKVYTVKELSHVDASKYRDGTIFLSDNEIGIINQGKLVNILTSLSKQEKGLTKAQVTKMINDAIKKVGE